ncbi:MAG: GNAT family N-acetyltransferase [Minwuia sp.]|uniref:GNAT family N-acetyltransferase n=1 Tax=Minwuia sp. TaxID=2493630 RepID=UPI003A872BBE
MGESEDVSDEYVLKLCGDISTVAAEDWDACAGEENPFVCHTFLQALEESGCASAEEGWMPQHLLLEDPSGRLIGCAPMYLKSHSQGEYVFDHGWANALERAGGRYYPKLQIAVPFTPATGPRLLVRDGEDLVQTRRMLLQGAAQAASQMKVSSLHITFPTEAEARLGRSEGWLFRTGEQFHWENNGYADFDAFLEDLASRKRKAIRKERKGALENDIEVEEITGADLNEDHWDAFYRFYMDTGSRKWGRPYLNRTFFSLLGDRMGENVVLMMAKREGRYIAGALNFAGSETLFGRYWGCIEDHRFLHFELCYYRAIDWAIRHGLSRVEAGAQGPHKLARGYLPVTTHSIHWIADPGFRRAVDDYLEHERREVQREIDYLSDLSPFRKGGKYTPDEGAI